MWYSVSLGPELPDVWQALAGPPASTPRAADEWTGGMSGNAFVGDQVVLDVGFDAARCRLRRLAADGVLLGAAEYAYGAAITGLAEERGPRQRCPGWLGWNPETWWKRRTVPGSRCDGRRSVPTAPGPGPGCGPHSFAGRGRDHGACAGGGLPAASPAGAGRAGPGHRVLRRRRGQPQLHRPPGLCSHASRWRGTPVRRAGQNLPRCCPDRCCDR
jgi:hypothetical protein